MRTRFWVIGMLVVVVGGAAWWLLRTPGDETGAVEVGSGEAARPLNTPSSVRDASLQGTGTANQAAARDMRVPSAWGRVIDAQGRAVAGVEVAALRLPPRGWHRSPDFRALRRFQRPEPPTLPVAASATTDAAGRFRLYELDRLARHRFEARPSAPWARAHLAPYGFPPHEQELVLVLGEGGDLTLRVVDEHAEGLPAAIEVWGTKPWGSLARDATDEEGRLTLRGLPRGVHRLYARVPGRGSRAWPVAVPTAGEIVILFAAPQGASVAGHVRDGAGAPVEGALVLASAYPADRAEGSWAQLGTRTDVDGGYRIAGFPPGRLQEVTAWAPGHLYAKHGAGNAELAAGSTYPADLVLPSALALEGLVKTETGRALEGVQVLAVAGRDQVGAVSDAEGAVRLSPLPQRAATQVTGWKPGWYAPLQTVTPDEGALAARFTLVMRRGHRLHGRCVDDAGQPVANVVVRGIPDQTRTKAFAALFDHTSFVVSTDADGAFVLEGVPPDSQWRLEARHAAHRGVLGPIGPWKVDEEPEALVFPLTRAARISGRVADEAGAPVAALRVRLPNQAGNTHTDDTGAFTLEGLEARSYKVYAADGSETLAEIRVEGLRAGEHREGVELVVPPRLSLTGQLVTADGLPASFLPLQFLPVDAASGRKVQTQVDGAGRFTVHVWGAGPYRAAVGTTSLSGEVTAGGSEPVRLVMPADLPPLTVRIVDESGQPVPKAHLTFHKVMADGGSLGGGYAVDGGVYEFSPGGRAGLVRIEVDRPTDAEGNPLPLLSKTLPIDRSDREIEVVLARGLQITGTVHDEGGHPIEGVRVSAARPTRFRNFSWVLTDGDGRFTLAPLDEGTYEVKCVGGEAWLPLEPVEVEAGTQRLDLRLVRGASFIVEVQDPADQGVPAVKVLLAVRWGERSLRRRGETDADGRYEARGIPREATFQITASTTAASGAAYPTVRLEDVPYRDGSVVIHLVEGVYVEGTVVSPEGTPVTTGAVTAKDENGLRAASVKLDAETGTFRLGPLTPGRYRVIAKGPRGTAPSESIEVDAPAKELRLVLRHQTTITGRLLNAAGGKWSIEWLTKDMGWSGIVKPDGSFEFKNVYVCPGTLFLREQEGSRLVLLEDVDPTQTSFEVTATEGHVMRGRVQGEGASFIGLERGRAYLGSRVEDDGTFEVRGVPDGRWKVTAFGEDGPLARREDVPADATDVVLMVPASGR